MSKYSNFKFFDSNSNELNLKYDSTKQSWEGIVYLPEVSTGLYETLTLYILEEARCEMGSVRYIKPIADATSVNNNIQVSFENEYDSSGNIILYTSSLTDGELYIKNENTQLKTRLPYSTSTGTLNGFNQVSSVIPSEPIQINVALKSDIETYHRRTLIIDEINAAGSITGRIATIRVYGETVGEDERLETLLSNIGMSLTPTDHFVFEDADIRESSPDWKLINRKRRELLLEAANIKPFIGTYKALLNAIKYFGYENITLEEYWLNINETAEGFGKLKAVAVPNQNVTGFLATKNSTSELPNSNLKKTSRFSLVYRLNNATGEYDEWDIPKVKEALEFSPDEVLIKLYGLKNRLQKSYIPMQAKIVDIVGAGDYFSQFNINTWNNQQNISSVGEGVDVGFDVFPKRGLYLEDLRNVSPWLTGKGQDFDELIKRDSGAYWKLGDSSNHPKTIDSRDGDNDLGHMGISLDDYVLPATTEYTSMSGGSIKFSPTNGNLATAKHPDFQLEDEITAAAWVNFHEWNYSGNNTDIFTIMSCSEQGGWSLSYMNKRIVLKINVNGQVIAANPGTTDALTTFYNLFSSGNTNDTNNGWHLISFTFDGRYIKIYIDGVQAPDHTTYPNSANKDLSIAPYNFPTSGNKITYKNTDSSVGSNTLYIGAEPTGNPAYSQNTFEAYWHGNIGEVGVIGRALNSVEMLDAYNNGMKKYFGDNVETDIKTFYGEYENSDLSTFSDISIPVGCPVILKANSLKDTWDDCDISYDDANDGKEWTYGLMTAAEIGAITGLNGNDAIGQMVLRNIGTPSHQNMLPQIWNGSGWHTVYNGFTWDKWWHKNIYEVEWRITGPDGYNRTFRGNIENYYEFYVTLPFIGKYSVDLSFYDLSNVRSFKAVKEVIEVKSKEVETYGITQSKSPVLNWNRYDKYSWITAGSDWNTAAENTSSIEDFVGSYYLTMDRANYANDGANWKHSTVVRYSDPANITSSGFSETAGPYAYKNMKKHNWNDGETMSWDMCTVSSDALAAFKITFVYLGNGAPAASSNYSSIFVEVDGVQETYVITNYPTADTDIAGWTAVETELNALTSTANPWLSQFTYNLVIEDTNLDGDITDQGTDTCKFILGVANKDLIPITDIDHIIQPAASGNWNHVLVPSYNLHKMYNPTYANTKVINQHDIYNKLNHFTFSFDNSKVPGVLSHEWSIKNNNKNIGDIYYNNRWLTYVFDEKGDYTIGLKLTDVNGNKMETTKNILTIK